MSTIAVVLAAGMSKRFGDADKLLADFGARPLTWHAAEVVRSFDLSGKIAVISNPALKDCFTGFDLVQLQDGSGGLAASLVAGLVEARKRRPTKLLIVLADMPRVTPALLGAIIEKTTQDQPAAASDGISAMPPACFPSVYFDELAQLSGDNGAKDILKALPRSALVIHPH